MRGRRVRVEGMRGRRVRPEGWKDRGCGLMLSIGGEETEGNRGSGGTISSITQVRLIMPPEVPAVTLEREGVKEKSKGYWGGGV